MMVQKFCMQCFAQIAGKVVTIQMCKLHWNEGLAELEPWAANFG